MSQRCQALAGEHACTDILMVRALAERFLDSLPATETPVERLLLRQLLLEMALRWATEIHKGFHKKRTQHCPFNPTTLILECWEDRAADPSEVFARWSVRFVSEFERSHIPPLASRVRKYVEDHLAERIAITQLAKELRCTRARAIAEFHKAYGLSPHQHQRRLRVSEGLRLLRATNAKIEAVARTVGFRSKKNFYNVTRDATGRTPTQIRDKKHRA
ncbi:MAG TPA: AraC family transcriptional regulator [Vicinamibacterales bacterium]|nr:AraC family transcriptional regulator [Vicinamibacterales bacterium]